MSRPKRIGQNSNLHPSRQNGQMLDRSATADSLLTAKFTNTFQFFDSKYGGSNVVPLIIYLVTEIVWVIFKNKI